MRISPIQRQSLISFVSIIALTFIGYLSTMYFSHVLGPAILGSYFLFLAYYGVFDLIGDGGFGGAAVKRISEDSEPNQYFSAFIVLRLLLLSGFICILLFFSSYFVDLRESGLFMWLLLALAIGTVSSFAANGLYGSSKVGVVQISTVINTIVKILIQVIAVYAGYALAGLVGGFILGIIAGAIINFYHLHLRFVRFSFEHLRSLFSFSFWIFLASSGSMVFAYADTILIGYFMSTADVGIYRIAFQLTGAASFTTVSLHYVLYPRVSNWHAIGEVGKAESALSRAFTYSLLLAIPVVVGGLILGEQLLYFLYGAGFESGTTALFILFLVQIANIFMYLQTMSLNAFNKPKKSFISTATAAILNIGLNIALIPFFGIAGAAFATFVSISINAIISYAYLSRSMHVRLERKPVLHITLATLPMAGVVMIFRFLIGISSVLLLAAAVTVGALIYFLVLFRIDRGIKEDLRSIISVFGIPWPVII